MRKKHTLIQQTFLLTLQLAGFSDTMSVKSYETLSTVSTRLEELEFDSTIAGTEVQPADLAPENANLVYGVYDFTQNYDDRLPISRFREQVQFVCTIYIYTLKDKYN